MRGESKLDNFHELKARRYQGVLDLCVETGQGLPLGHKRRNFKGGVVVWTQRRNNAVFQELAEQPTTLEVSCDVDAYGCIGGHTIEQVDVEQAYVQALMQGAPTYVRLPKHQWPKEWEGKRTDPVAPLKLALFGHPDSAVYWAQKAHKKTHREASAKSKTGRAAIGNPILGSS